MREDIKKRREKYNIKSDASKLFGNKELVTDRKFGMSFAQFKVVQVVQKKAIKALFGGSPNSRISALMKPTIPSVHLQTQVAQKQAIKHGWLEEVVAEKGYISDFFTNLFNNIRQAFNGGIQTPVRSRS